MKKITLLFALYCIATTILNAQTTAIPDANFEQALIDLGIDSNGLNGNILNSDAQSVTALDVSNKNISSLAGIEAFINITTLGCSQNSLTSLNLSQNTALRGLWCHYNDLSSLDVSQNTLLELLFCTFNDISSLDLSQNTSLESVTCQNNQLTNLDVRNGNNTNFTSFNAINNPNLSCIDVDDVGYAVANWSFGIDPQTSFSIECDAATVYVPDDNFEQAIIDLGLDLGGPVLDDYVIVLNMNSLTTLDISSKSISDFTGIEQFTALENLNVSLNPITQSITFDISSLSALKILTCAFNQLTSLDVSNNTALEELNCSTNQLINLNTSNNPALKKLFCNSNNLTGLNTTNNTLLEELRSSNNPFTSNLNVSSNTALKDLRCENSQLTSLDLSNNSALVKLSSFGNQLTSLNMKNGNNTNVTLFNTTSNPNLSCIAVDNVAYSTANWTSIDPATTFAESQVACSLGIDDLERNMNFSLYPNPATDKVHIEIKKDLQISKIEMFDVSGKKVIDFTYTNNTIDVNKLQSGIYFISIIADRSLVTKKLIIN